jgi:hypothetical protein
MLGQLCDAWPPASESAPAANQGTRTTDGFMDIYCIEPLHDLHDGAWWTGLKILAPRNPSARFKVKIIRNDGERIGPDWQQDANDWQTFPWPIPAAMARDMGLCIKIKQIDSGANGCILTRRVMSFLECPDMSGGESLLFVDDDGDLYGYWDARQIRYGSRYDRDTQDNPTPRWGEEHTVVPMSSQLITRRDWDLYRTFTPEDWDSRVHF